MNCELKHNIWRNVLPVQLRAQTNFLHYNFPWRIKVQLNSSDSDTCVLAPQQVLSIGKRDLADSREARPVTSDLWDPDLSQQLGEHLHDSKVRKFAFYSEVSRCKAIICLSGLFGLRWGLGSYRDKHKWRLAVSLESKKPPQREHNPSAHNFWAIHFSNYFFQSLCLTIASIGYPLLPLSASWLYWPWATMSHTITDMNMQTFGKVMICSPSTICLRSILSGVLGGQEVWLSHLQL